MNLGLETKSETLDLRDILYNEVRVRIKNEILSDNGYFTYNTNPYRVVHQLTHLKEQGRIKEGDSFIDLGSSLGVNTLAAKKLGFASVGIEYDNWLVESSRLLEHYCNMSSGEINFVQGTFFPHNYIQLREEGMTLAPEFEEEFIVANKEKVKSIPTYEMGRINEHFIMGADAPDGYVALGKNIDTIDVFFAYTWGKEVASILEMFSLYAKEDAVFINHSSAWPARHEELLERLHLQSEYSIPNNMDKYAAHIITKK